MSQRARWVALSLSLSLLTEQTGRILDIRVAVVEVEIFENVDSHLDFRICLLYLVIAHLTATLPVSG